MRSGKFSVLIRHMLTNLTSLKGRYWWFACLLWMVFVLPAQATEMRVAIKKDVSQLKIGSSTTAVVKDGSGKQIGELVGMSAISASASGGNIALNNLKAKEVFIEPAQDGYVWIGDRWYRGKVRLMSQNGGMIAVNHVSLEDYLYSVVGAEAVASWPLESLKAQAVSARSYALYKKNTSGSSIFDLDTTQATQVYKGLDTEYTTTHQAVDGTRGQVMTYNKRVILAVFHSSSGGHTENVEDIWTSALPYLRAVADYDHQAPVFQWTKTFSENEMDNLVGGVGKIRAMIPQKTTPFGRVVTMKVVGDRGAKTISGDDVRSALKLRSTLFRVADVDGEFQVTGRGFGHGLGLSQWGAYFLAKQGVRYQQILDHYYKNSALSKVS
jgi:stage II sporulation protein D